MLCIITAKYREPEMSSLRYSRAYLASSARTWRLLFQKLDAGLFWVPIRQKLEFHAGTRPERANSVDIQHCSVSVQAWA